MLNHIILYSLDDNFGATKLALLVAIHFFWIVVCFLVLKFLYFNKFEYMCTVCYSLYLFLLCCLAEAECKNVL